MGKCNLMKTRSLIFFAILIRLGLFLSFGRNYATDFYFPFLDSVDLDIDPWSSWLINGGRKDALPYGLVLFSCLLVIVKIEFLLRQILPILPIGTVLIFSLITIDLQIFKKLSGNNRPNINLIYLFSPIVIYVNYVYVQTDAIVGALLLFFAIRLLSRQEKAAGIMLGLAVGCKFGVLVILPFLIIFALANKRFRSSIRSTVLWSIPITVISYLPSLWSSGFRSMVFLTKENSQIFALTLNMGPMDIMVFPMVYLLLIIWILRAGKSNLKVLLGFIGTSLLVLSITSTSAVGWHLWGLSILIMLSFWGKTELIIAFAGIQVAIVMRDLFSPNPLIFGITMQQILLFNLFFTASVTLGSVWTISNLRKIVSQADTLQLNSKPLLVSIAGDSGVGKDTLAYSLSKIIGIESTTIIAGDSYHKYERGNKRWNGKTHLNTSQNNLDLWQRDIKKALKRNKFYKQEYDHTHGRFSELELVKPGDLIISQGLHALIGSTTTQSDAKIFMEMEDLTRINFKIKRDTDVRNRNIADLRKELIKRKKDFRQFISPQKNVADLIFFQKASKVNLNNISELRIELLDINFAEFLYLALMPYIKLIRFDIQDANHNSIHLSETSIIDAESLNLILQNSLISYEELRITKNNLETGSLGVMNCVCLLFLEYKRRYLDN